MAQACSAPIPREGRVPPRRSPTAEPPIRCVIADDHPPVLAALGRLLAASGLDVVGAAADGEEALSLVRDHQPDIALLDIRLPGLDGVQALRRIGLLSPRTRVVLYTGYSDPRLLRQGLAAGAQGIVLKESPVQEVVRALRAVAAGARYVDATATRLLGAGDPPCSLSRREQQVLELLAAGLDTEAIARRLALSPHTLRTHIRNLLRKLGARTRAQAVAEALRRGLLS
jgi:DNA-binding NarL/FixJ family response regulator